jgi:hypothetical protein
MLSAFFLAAGLLAGGCGRGNGLPSDLKTHLADRGIGIAPTRVNAPISSRGGFIVTPYNLETVTSIVTQFKLEKVGSDNPLWQQAIAKAGGNVAAKEVWAVAGRPPQFKLKNGGQFQYFYLLVTTDGTIYLIAEYAYG